MATLRRLFSKLNAILLRLLRPATIALAVLAVSFFYTVDTAPKVPLCQFYKWFQKPCPGCGLTRAFLSISHGEFARAHALNPFGWGFYAITLATVFSPLLSRTAWWPKVWASRLFQYSLTWALITFVLCLMIWGTRRLIEFDPATSPLTR
jgi:hypothetical protein